MVKDQDESKEQDEESKLPLSSKAEVLDWSQFLPAGYVEGDINHSGKLTVLFQLLSKLHTTEDRIVIVSNYTTTLRLIEILCLAKGYCTVRSERFKLIFLKVSHLIVYRLDGSTEVQKRGEMVASFNSAHSQQFIFLLSSKAGGCGLNLIGANR